MAHGAPSHRSYGTGRRGATFAALPGMRYPGRALALAVLCHGCNVEVAVDDGGGPRPDAVGYADAATALAGWDYDLTRRCARTTGANGDANYYEDATQCDSAQHWTLVVESETAPAQSCPGPLNRSFPINAPGSPIQLDWIPHQSDLGANWTAAMKVDQVTSPSPCGPGLFTYFGMLDHIDLGGGPLPGPTSLIASHVVVYDDWAPTEDTAARLVVGATFYWGGKAHWLEISPTRTPTWGDGDPHPGIVIASKAWGTPDVEFVLLDGPFWGIDVTRGASSFLFIDWAGYIDEMIRLGYFDPIGDLPSVTQSVYIGVEVKGPAVANLYQTNFRTASRD